MRGIVALLWNPGPLVLELFRKPLRRSSIKWPPGCWWNSDHPRPCAYARAVTSVQQPCINPSKSPEMLRKVPKQKYDDLQVFCKLQNSPANYRAAFTRQRSLVRTQHRPLLKYVVLQVERKRTEEAWAWSTGVIRYISCCVDPDASSETGRMPSLPRPSCHGLVVCETTKHIRALVPNFSYP
jgi:hypothetical protein